MPIPDVRLKPGPKALAAAFSLAGFSINTHLPAVTDAAGVRWASPSELQVALAISGAESSGHTYAWHVNTDGSTDYGQMQINAKYHAQYFQAVKEYTDLNWAKPLDNAKMAYSIYEAAGKSFSPWNSYEHGRHLLVRANGKTWMDWAQHGISQMVTQVGAAMKAGQTWYNATCVCATVDLDPINY